MATRPTIEPEERSTPAVMITWVTPTAMMPITDTCRMMIDSRCLLARKLSPTKIQPRISNTSAMPISTPRIDTSGGSRRLVPMMPAGPATSVVMAVSPRSQRRRSMRRQFHDLDLVGLGAVEEAGHPSFVHDHDAIAHAEHL